MSDSADQNTISEQDRTKKQQRGIKITIVVIVVFISCVLGLFLNKMLTPRTLSNTELLANGAVEFKQPRIIKPFELVDHNSESFDLSRLEGKWTIAYFGFTFCPDICPMTLATIKSMLKKLDPKTASQIQVVLFSVDPARDTPEQLKQYVAHFSEDFIGVTGEFLTIKRLTENVNVAFNKVVEDDGYTVDHTGNIVLINPKGHYHGFFRPPFETSRLQLTLQSIMHNF